MELLKTMQHYFEINQCYPGNEYWSKLFEKAIEADNKSFPLNAEVIVKLADDEKKILDMLFASKTAEIQAHIIFDEPLEKRMGKVKLMGKLNEIHKKLSKFSE